MTDLNSWHVLIIDDEHDSAEVLQEVLQTEGISVRVAHTAEDGLRMISQLMPTLMIVDLALPKMDGWGFLENIRETPSTSAIPAIAITAYHSLDVARKAIEAGFNAYFPKPIDSRSFVTELTRIVG